MVYDAEIVRKNIKYMRRFYGVTQTELSKVLKVEQHSVSQYETGKRSLNYEYVQLLANYFRIPIEEFVKEDLSNIMVYNLDVDIDFIFEFLDIIFPKFLVSETMEDVYFQKGCKCLNSIREDFKKNKVISIKKYEECIDLFLQSYRKFQTLKSIANTLGVILVFYAPQFTGEEEEEVGKEIYKQRRISKQVLKKYFLREEIVNNPIKKEFIEKYNDFVMEGIRILKEIPEWSQLGDYYLALRYIIGMVENDNNQDMNILIGEEFMINLFELDNKYATLYLEKKSSFFLEK